MGNSWKTKCVDIGSCKDAKLTDVIVVENGTVVSCNYGKWTGYSGTAVQSFNDWFKYHEVNTGTKWELITDEIIETVTDIIGNTLSRVILDSDEATSDAINPNHYKSQCSLECIETMLMAFGGTVVYDFCICNAWKYMWRYQNKNGKEDLTKARWYLDMAEKVDCDRTEHWNIETVLNELEEKSHDN